MSTPVSTPSQRTLLTGEALQDLKIDQLRALARAHATRPRKSVAVNTLSDAKVVSFLISKGLATHWGRIARACQSGGDLGPTPPRGVARREWFVDNLILGYALHKEPEQAVNVGGRAEPKEQVSQVEQSPVPPSAQGCGLDGEGREGSAGVEAHPPVAPSAQASASEEQGREDCVRMQARRARSKSTETEPPRNQLASSTYGSCRLPAGTTNGLALREGTPGEAERSDPGGPLATQASSPLSPVTPTHSRVVARGHGDSSGVPKEARSDPASAVEVSGHKSEIVEEIAHRSEAAWSHDGSDRPVNAFTDAEVVGRSSHGDGGGDGPCNVLPARPPLEIDLGKRGPRPGLPKVDQQGFVHKWLIHQRCLAVGGDGVVGDWPQLVEHASHDAPGRPVFLQPAAPGAGVSRAWAQLGSTKDMLATGRAGVPNEDYIYEEVLQNGLGDYGFRDGAYVPSSSPSSPQNSSSSPVSPDHARLSRRTDTPTSDLHIGRKDGLAEYAPVAHANPFAQSNPLPLVRHVSENNHWGDGDVWTAEGAVAVLGFDYRYPSHGPGGYKRVDILTLWLRYVRAQGVVLTNMNTFLRELAIAIRLIDANVVISMGTKVQGLLWYHPVAETTGDGNFIFLKEDDEDVEVLALDPRERSQMLAHCQFGIYCRLDQHCAPEESSRGDGVDHSAGLLVDGDGTRVALAQLHPMDLPPASDPVPVLPMAAVDPVEHHSQHFPSPREASLQLLDALELAPAPAPATGPELAPVLKATHKTTDQHATHSTSGRTHGEGDAQGDADPSSRRQRGRDSPHPVSTPEPASPPHEAPISPPPVSAAEEHFRAALRWLRAEFGTDEIVVDMICEKPKKSQVPVRMLRWIKRTHELARLGRVRVDRTDVRITKRVLAELLRRKNQFLNHAIDSQELIDTGHPAVKRAIERLIAQGSKIGASSLYKGLSQAVQNPDVDVEWPTNIEDDEDEDKDKDPALPPKRSRKKSARTRDGGDAEGASEGARYSPLNEQGRRELLELAAWEGPDAPRREAPRRLEKAKGFADRASPRTASELDAEGGHEQEDNAWLFDEDQDDDICRENLRRPKGRPTHHSESPPSDDLSPSPVALTTTERIALRPERLAALRRDLLSPVSSQAVPEPEGRTTRGRPSEPRPFDTRRRAPVSSPNESEGSESLSRDSTARSGISYASDPDAEGETDEEVFAPPADGHSDARPSTRAQDFTRGPERSPVDQPPIKRARKNSRTKQASPSESPRARSRSPIRKRARHMGATGQSSGARVASTEEQVEARAAPAVTQTVPMVRWVRKKVGGVLVHVPQ
ncbi:hypothetical protein C8Q76DRAFT_791276 [Earliella scabrosa]|nr:hypothetical protein C8Q76DRAFT_791276 [Earliella scabrosa]